MANDLSKLPPPPTGQTGVFLSDIQKLPPPPQGQQGMTLDQIKSQQQPPQQPQVPSLMDRLIHRAGDFVTAPAELTKLHSQDFAGAISQPTGPKGLPVLSAIGKTALHGAGAVGGAIGDVTGAVLKQSFGDISNNPELQQFSHLPVVSKSLDAVNKGISTVGNAVGAAVDKFKTAVGPENARLADDAANTLNILPFAKGIGLAKDVLLPAAEKGLLTGASDGVTNATKALNPALKGKELQKAYGEVVTGGRTTTKAGVFTEQGLSPNARTVNLAQRLSDDIKLSDGSAVPKIELSPKNQLANQKVLQTALNDTETRLDAALKSDPQVNYNADKPKLFENLNEAQKTAPNEFRIGESKKMTENVFRFARQVAQQAKDTIAGLRDARTSFDAQAKKQYPNAFKPDGSIDTKTAAGSAIKTARDIFNEHLYNTAPNGSDIQKLIGREADIFHANTPVSAKAASAHGKTLPQKVLQTVKDHPILSGIGAYEAGKHLGGF